MHRHLWTPLAYGLVCSSVLSASCDRSATRPASDGITAGSLSNIEAARATTGGVNSLGQPPAPAIVASQTKWLRTEKNRILGSDNTPFRGRGANIFDTRQCGSCGWAPPHVQEVIRRIDELTNGWHANFLRLALTSFATDTEKGIKLAQWGDITQDPLYLADLKRIVDHIGSKAGVYVMIAIFIHPSLDAHGLPTAATVPVYRKLVETFKDSPHVMFGVCNEPHDTTDDTVWTAMNDAVQAIRDAEGSGPQHLVAVQGTQNYARRLDYYLGKRITAGGGKNVVYETHVYNHASDWQSMFIGPSNYLPVVIGEFGPAEGYMTLEDSKALMPKAEEVGVPYLAWSFSPQCWPALVQVADNPTDCGEGLSLAPSDWGAALKERLKKPW